MMVLTDKQAWRLIVGVDRAERERDPVAYTKAVRATLLELGYDSTWVNGRFHALLDAAYFEGKDTLAEAVASLGDYYNEGGTQDGEC